MPDRNQNKNPPLVDNVIPFRKNTKPSSAGLPPTEADAFLVKTDEIFFLIILYLDKNSHYQGNGYAIFPSGEKVCFTIVPNGNEDVREKCIKIGERIAREHSGTLQHGSIDEYGRFNQADDQAAEP